MALKGIQSLEKILLINYLSYYIACYDIKKQAWMKAEMKVFADSFKKELF